MENHTKLFYSELGPVNLEKCRPQGTWASPPLLRGKGRKVGADPSREPQGTIWVPCWMPPRQGFKFTGRRTLLGRAAQERKHWFRRAACVILEAPGRSRGPSGSP